MARNEEKAMGLLNRWTSYKRELVLGGGARKGRRPHLARLCDDLNEATGHRRSIVRELTGKIEEIQDASVGEHRLRELNDDINKLLREKYHWERQIEHLGGPSLGERGQDGRKYKYFGAARELPQVRELLQRQQAPAKPRGAAQRRREEILAGLDHTYFESAESAAGDAQGLLQAERAAEEAAHAEQREHDAQVAGVPVPELTAVGATDFERLLLETVGYSDRSFLTEAERAALDTSKAAEALVVERKKRELLSKYIL